MANLKDTFVLGKLTVTDSIIADKFKGPLEGNAATATKFNTSRTFSFAGDVSGTVTTDCASGFEVNLSVADNSHSHTYDNITNLSVPLDQWLESANAYTDGKISDLIDGAGADLDTLKELSAALNNDKDFAKNVLDLIATKIPLAGTNSTTGPITGGLTFSVADAIKYKGTKNTYTMIKFIDNATDVNGNGIMIGGGGSVYIGSGESAANLYSALSSPSGGDEAIYISGDDAIKFYSNCQTIASRKETTYDKSGNWTMPGTITATQFTGPSKALYSSGFGNGTLTYLQTSSDFNGNSGWAHYLIANHGDGEIYYNYTIALPFWGAPKYRRKTGYAGDAAAANRATDAAAKLSEWYDFVTSENYNTILDNTYLQLTGGTMSGGLTVNGKATFTGGVDIRGNAADKPLIVRGITGSDGSGNIDALYLQYGANKPVYFGNTGTHTISADGANYSGNAASASALTNITTSDNASSSATKRRIWFAYSDNTTGRPAYDDRFTIQTSTGTLFAPIFSGDLSGTATKALQDGDGLVIKDTYLKLSGGTITGGLTVNGSTLLKSTLTIGSSSGDNVSPKVGIHVHDLRNLGRGQSGDEAAPWPGLFGDKSVNFYFDEINDSYGGSTATNRWMSIMHMKGWTGAYAAWELAGNAHSNSNQDTLRYRQGINNSWGAWQSVLTDANFTTYLDSTYVNVTGDTMTGTLTLTSPTGSSEGGQIVLAHTQNSNTQNGIVIDTANSDFRIFGNPSKTGTASSNYGSILTYSPYDLKLSICSIGSGNGHFQYNTSDKCIDVLFT